LLKKETCAVRGDIVLTAYPQGTSLSRKGTGVEIGGVAQRQNSKMISLSSGRGVEGAGVIHGRLTKKGS
jgi:hypothetical protein